METFLTVKELSEQIKMAPQTIYNKIHKNEFQQGIHYLKPSHKKILFKESAILTWLNGGQINQNASDQPQNSRQFENNSKQQKLALVVDNRQEPVKNLINI